MMAEYIKLEDAIAIIEEKQKDLSPVGRYGRGYVYGTDREKYDSWDEIIDALENIPSADVVPVVWCKDCKYFNHEHMECENEAVSTDHEGGAQYSLNFWLNDFCSYGERKETE